MYERSTNAEFLKPTVVALAFGVGFAIFVTLLFVPAMYAVGADIARFYRWAWSGERQPKLGEGVSKDAILVDQSHHGASLTEKGLGDSPSNPGSGGPRAATLCGDPLNKRLSAVNVLLRD